MGTNYYWIEHKHSPFHALILASRRNITEDSPFMHIGKRSAAGLYCWSCKTTLCSHGTAHVHDSDSQWEKSCPFCHAIQIPESLDESAMGKELGFNRKPNRRRTGVSSCCSFTITSQKHYDAIYRYAQSRRFRKKLVIRDEYGGQFTAREFLDGIFDDCPIHLQTPGEFS